MVKANAKIGEIEPKTAEDHLTIEELNKQFSTGDNFVPDNFDDLVAQYEEEGGLLEFKGSIYDVVNKEALIGRAFAVVDARFYEGTYGPAVAVLALTEDNEHIVFNDGSSGVFAQFKHMVATSKRRGGFVCPKGLRKSDYTYQEKDFDGDPIGNPIPATTYYVA